jgi:hypothetical protein
MSDVFRKAPWKPLNEFEKERIEAIKTKAEELLDLMTNYPMNIDSARYNVLAQNDLESSVMWAVKAVTA